MKHEVFINCIERVDSMTSPFFWRDEYYYESESSDNSFGFGIDDNDNLNLGDANYFEKILEFLLITGEEAGFLPAFSNDIKDEEKVTKAYKDADYDNTFMLKSAFIDRVFQVTGFKIDPELSYSDFLSEERDVAGDYRDLDGDYRDALYSADGFGCLDICEDEELTEEETLTRIGEEYFSMHNVVIALYNDRFLQFRKKLEDAEKKGILPDTSILNRLLSDYSGCCELCSYTGYFDGIEYQGRHITSFFAFNLSEDSGWYSDIFQMPIDTYIGIEQLIDMLDFSEALAEEKKNLAKLKKDYKKKTVSSASADY